MPRIELQINGRRYPAEVESGMTLLEVLRDRLELTGAKYGCGEGECGACTVLMDGVAERSCLTPAAAAEGKQITTIEGLARVGSAGEVRLHPLQQAFLDEGAWQCGYCTAGMILSAAWLLGKHPDPTDEQIARLLEGNICRCGAYPRVVAAIRRAAPRLAVKRA